MKYYVLINNNIWLWNVSSGVKITPLFIYYNLENHISVYSVY